MSTYKSSNDTRPMWMWESLKRETIERIDEIDRQTVANPLNLEREPDWWLEMMDVRRLIEQRTQAR